MSADVTTWDSGGYQQVAMPEPGSAMDFVRMWDEAVASICRGLGVATRVFNNFSSTIEDLRLRALEGDIDATVQLQGLGFYVNAVGNLERLDPLPTLPFAAPE